jgi:hypothetical protein
MEGGFGYIGIHQPPWQSSDDVRYGRSNMKALSNTVYNETREKSITNFLRSLALDQGKRDLDVPGQLERRLDLGEQ